MVEPRKTETHEKVVRVQCNLTRLDTLFRTGEVHYWQDIAIQQMEKVTKENPPETENQGRGSPFSEKN